jgi:hypothetical protein
MIIEKNIKKEVTVALNWDMHCLPLSKKSIGKYIEQWASSGFTRINLRLVGPGGMEYRSSVRGSRKETMARFSGREDPLSVAAEIAHANGIEVFAYFDLFDTEGEKLLLERPDLALKNPFGKRHPSIMCYGYSEVRKYLLESIKEISKYDIDGVYYCTKSAHLDKMANIEMAKGGWDFNWQTMGCNEPIVMEYEKKYGSFDFINGKVDWKKWRDIHGDFIFSFFQETKEIIKEKGMKISASFSRNPKGMLSLPLYLDWQKMVEKNILDELILSNDRTEYGTYYTPSGVKGIREVTKLCHKNKVTFLGYVFADFPWWNIWRKYGLNRLYQYIEDEISLWINSGADGLVFQNIELFGPEYLKREVWEIVGKSIKKPLPSLFSQARMFKNQSKILFIHPEPIQGTLPIKYDFGYLSNDNKTGSFDYFPQTNIKLRETQLASSYFDWFNSLGFEVQTVSDDEAFYKAWEQRCEYKIITFSFKAWERAPWLLRWVMERREEILDYVHLGGSIIADCGERTSSFLLAAIFDVDLEFPKENDFPLEVFVDKDTQTGKGINSNLFHSDSAKFNDDPFNNARQAFRPLDSWIEEFPATVVFENQKLPVMLRGSYGNGKLFFSTLPLLKPEHLRIDILQGALHPELYSLWINIISWIKEKDLTQIQRGFISPFKQISDMINKKDIENSDFNMPEKEKGIIPFWNVVYCGAPLEKLVEFQSVYGFNNLKFEKEDPSTSIPIGWYPAMYPQMKKQGIRMIYPKDKSRTGKACIGFSVTPEIEKNTFGYWVTRPHISIYEQKNGRLIFWIKGADIKNLALKVKFFIWKDKNIADTQIHDIPITGNFDWEKIILPLHSNFQMDFADVMFEVTAREDKAKGMLLISDLDLPYSQITEKKQLNSELTKVFEIDNGPSNTKNALRIDCEKINILASYPMRLTTQNNNEFKFSVFLKSNVSEFIVEIRTNSQYADICIPIVHYNVEDPAEIHNIHRFILEQKNKWHNVEFSFKKIPKYSYPEIRICPLSKEGFLWITNLKRIK